RTCSSRSSRSRMRPSPIGREKAMSRSLMGRLPFGGVTAFRVFQQTGRDGVVKRLPREIEILGARQTESRGGDRRGEQVLSFLGRVGIFAVSIQREHAGKLRVVVRGAAH